jgi:hypothetical protein
MNFWLESAAGAERALLRERDEVEREGVAMGSFRSGRAAAV